MKKMFLIALTVFSTSSFAGTYICNFSVFEGEKLIGDASFEKVTGTSVGRIITIDISNDKNVRTEIALNGIVNAGFEEKDSYVDASISILKTPLKRPLEVEKNIIAQIKEVGNFEMSEINENYRVEGLCRLITKASLSQSNICE